MQQRLSKKKFSSRQRKLENPFISVLRSAVRMSNGAMEMKEE